jgi:hypothetical protein
MSRRAIPFSIIRDWLMHSKSLDICGSRRSFIFMFWPGTFAAGRNRRSKVVRLCRIVAETFSRASQLQISESVGERVEQYIHDILIALTRATPEQAFLLRAHVGNYSLFISGIFHPAVAGQRSMHGGPDLEFYEQVGRTNYQLVASHATARRCELDDVFEGLADQFRDVRLALNQLSDRLLNLDDDVRRRSPCERDAFQPNPEVI